MLYVFVPVIVFEPCVCGHLLCPTTGVGVLELIRNPLCRLACKQTASKDAALKSQGLAKGVKVTNPKEKEEKEKVRSQNVVHRDFQSGLQRN